MVGILSLKGQHITGFDTLSTLTTTDDKQKRQNYARFRKYEKKNDCCLILNIRTLRIPLNALFEDLQNFIQMTNCTQIYYMTEQSSASLALRQFQV